MKNVFLIVAALCAPALVASDCRIRHTGQDAFASPEVQSESALVTSTCLNRDFGYGIFPAPCNCPAGYTIYSNSDCSGQSGQYSSGGWITGQNNWPARSYRCDAASVAIRCIDKDFGFGTFKKPCECSGGYTIYDNNGCGGGSVHINSGGWTSVPGQHFSVNSYQCDAPDLNLGGCVNQNFGRGSFSKPAKCPYGYTIYSSSGCSAQSMHMNDGGWVTDSNAWPVMSYKCDIVKVPSTECTTRSYGIGTFPAPSECSGTYTIFESAGCKGQMVKMGPNGWVTRSGDWPVQSYRCDDDCNCQR
ncbi:hypothetical protein BGZ68_009538 [Mortierella alpina]|nr:hypothetical protein BGZ68_009538 [Mortierella alpina]